MVAEAGQAKMSAIKETEQANKDVGKAAREAEQALAEVRKYRNCAEQAKAKEEAEKVKFVYDKRSDEAVIDSTFKENLNGYKQQHENWKNTFIEQCLTCDQCKKSFNMCSTFKEHIYMEHKRTN